VANFWFKFEWDVWRNDKQLRRCSKETRGFWIDCIAEMESQQTYFLQGTPEEICREVTADRGEFDRSIAELSRHGAATIEKSQETVKIICRRLLKKLSTTEYNRLKQQERRSRQMSNDCQDPPSKDKSFRTLNSPIGEVQNVSEPPPSEPERPPEIPAPPSESEAPKVLVPLYFRPTPEGYAWFIENCKGLDLNAELEEFITFWRDIADRNNRRTMRGWHATWKARMKERQEKLAGSNALVPQQRQINGNGNGNSQRNTRQTASERNVERIVANRNLAERFASGELDEAVSEFLGNDVAHHREDPESRQLTAPDR
jgi:hypothetical protein